MKIDWTTVLSVAIGVLAASILANLISTMFAPKLEEANYYETDEL
jgi:hypothetical protein